MNIVILAGGTGSIALQQGLYDKSPDLDVKVIVNAYDNGLSTGAVRKVLDGKILGPSDVRKNQTTRLKLMKPESQLNKLLDFRFTTTPENAKAFCLHQIAEYKLPPATSAVLYLGVETFFSHVIAHKIDYDDFSLANIIYAGLANLNGNSLRAAARIMAGVMDIPDNVLLNDDTSLFLSAVTASGNRITDEGDIVVWNNPNDPIVDIFFTDERGLESMPTLCAEAQQAIADADVVILSSGTQWASLIPTYASVGFQSAMTKFKGRVIMVMNRQPDKDAPSMSASDIITTLVPKYFPPGQIDLILDEGAHPLMNTVTSSVTDALLKSVQAFKMGGPLKNTVHQPYRLADAIIQTIYKDYLGAAKYVFDYDDTLIGRGNSFANASAYNTRMLLILLEQDVPVVICTGNSIKAIKMQELDWPRNSAPLIVYADGGVNKYEYIPPTVKQHDDEEESRAYTFIECIQPDAQFQNGAHSATNIISALRVSGIPSAKIENRGNVMLSIKPIDPEYREIVRNLIAKILDRSGLTVRSAGRTTIEVSSPLVDKAAAVKEMLINIGQDKSLVFVGDEFEDGNDASIKNLAKTDKRIKCLRVKNPSDTALFLMALKQQYQIYG